MTRVFSIDGNIGSGKSTFVNKLKAYYANPKNCCGKKIGFLQEPIDIWNTIRDTTGKTMIECYYADPKQYAFAFQMMAYISRLATLKEELKNNYDIIFSERCLLTDRNVFAKMLYDDGKINEIEYQIYNKWFDEFIADFPIIEYIYLRTEPETALARITKRARPGETIPIEYLTKCHEYHDAWLNKYDNKCIIDCNANTDEDGGENIIAEWINQVDNIIINDTSKKQYTYEMKFDGASRGNPGLCGAGFVITKDEDVVFKQGYYLSDKNTNNYAEYRSLICGLEKCAELKLDSINIQGDSLIVIKQLKKEYNVNSPNLIPLHTAATKLLDRIPNYDINHIPRNQNNVADSLANKAIDEYQDTLEQVVI